MQFKDAAYEILKHAGGPLHYNEITERAMTAGILAYSGQTPHATMAALLYTDTLKPDSRFRRGDQKGTFALRAAPPSDIQQQINAIDSRVRKTLHARLLLMHPKKFENLIQSLLDAMGLDKTTITTYSDDGGIDIRGVLNAENLSRIDVAVQAKRWKANVGANVVRELRGSLKVHEHGIVITPSDFTAKAIAEADEPGKTHISLINGEELVDLLIQRQVGVKQQEYIVPILDDEYWTEILGDELQESGEQHGKEPTKTKSKALLKFPLQIQATYKGQIYQAELLDTGGKVRYSGQVYDTPSAAAKAVAQKWKAVNGWDFWRYTSLETGKLLKIGTLK